MGAARPQTPRRSPRQAFRGNMGAHAPLRHSNQPKQDRRIPVLSCPASGVRSERLRKEGHHFIFDDDDAGEAADIITVDESSGILCIHLYHCKFSSGAQAGARIKDCYEVCGQAVKSARWVDNHLRLLNHIQRRENKASRGSRESRFEHGSRRALANLTRQAKRMHANFRISIVQPGILKSKVTSGMSSVLGAADTFIRDFTGHEMGVFGSE